MRLVVSDISLLKTCENDEREGDRDMFKILQEWSDKGRWKFHKYWGGN